MFTGKITCPVETTTSLGENVPATGFIYIEFNGTKNISNASGFLCSPAGENYAIHGVGFELLDIISDKVTEL